MWISELDFSLASLEFVAEHHSSWLFLTLVLFAILQEDVATATIALTAAHGHIPVQMGLAAVMCGILVCDLAIFAIGWFSRRQKFALRFFKHLRVRRVKRLVKRNMIPTILVTRCLPGMRLPTYFALGFFHANPMKFFTVAVGAVALWSAFLFGLSYVIGDQVLRTIEGPQFWFFVIAFIVFIAVVPGLVIKRLPVMKEIE